MTKPDHTTGSPPSLTEHVADGQGRDDAGVLLGLEPSAIEKAGENSTMPKDSNPSTCYAPLLGTICSHPVENTGLSSGRRCPESVCYDKLLREHGPTSGRKSRKTVSVEGRGCYLAITPDVGHRLARKRVCARPHLAHRRGSRCRSSHERRFVRGLSSSRRAAGRYHGQSGPRVARP